VAVIVVVGVGDAVERKVGVIIAVLVELGVGVRTPIASNVGVGVGVGVKGVMDSGPGIVDPGNPNRSRKMSSVITGIAANHSSTP
jgi:hypothetical protein